MERSLLRDDRPDGLVHGFGDAAQRSGATARPGGEPGVTVGRVYLPATLPALRRMLDGSPLPVTGAYAVTDRLRSLLADPADGEDVEDELAEAAIVAAADASLSLLSRDRSLPARRVVVAADVAAIPLDTGEHPAAVTCRGEVALGVVASLLADDEDAVPAVRIVLDALAAGDQAGYAQALDDLDGHGLSWYDASELAEIVGSGEGGADGR
jgi:hypothetical protein